MKPNTPSHQPPLEMESPCRDTKWPWSSSRNLHPFLGNILNIPFPYWMPFPSIKWALIKELNLLKKCCSAGRVATLCLTPSLINFHFKLYDGSSLNSFLIIAKNPQWAPKPQVLGPQKAYRGPTLCDVSLWYSLTPQSKAKALAKPNYLLSEDTVIPHFTNCMSCCSLSIRNVGWKLFLISPGLCSLQSHRTHLNTFTEVVFISCTLYFCPNTTFPQSGETSKGGNL